MSASDVRDMLNLPKEVAPRPTKKMKTEVRKLEGMQRELYSLLGENTPPLAVIENKFKGRPDWRNAKKITPWRWRGFKHTGRDDGLVLHHWVRGAAEEDEVIETDYHFAKYNSKMELPVIKAEDYKKLEDDGWSLEETSYLFDMCKEYDLRWLVIDDRYKYPNRTIEDLKARFYDVMRRMFKMRQERGEKLTKADEDLYNSMNYSKESELKRKEHLDTLLQRKPAEIAEEEALVIESRKLEAAAERMILERQELLKLLEAPTAAQSTIAQYTTSQGLQQLQATLLSDKTKRRKDNTPPPVAPGQLLPSSKPAPATSTPPSAAGATAAAAASSTTNTTSTATKQEKKSGHQLGQQAVQQILSRKISAREEAALGISYHEKLQTGVHFRSTKITTYKPAVQAKVTAALQELKIPARPVMPTAKVCAKFESLQNSINVMLETKKVIDKLETDIKVLKNRL